MILFEEKYERSDLKLQKAIMFEILLFLLEVERYNFAVTYYDTQRKAYTSPTLTKRKLKN